jgi:hypothetical protein
MTLKTPSVFRHANYSTLQGEQKAMGDEHTLQGQAPFLNLAEALREVEEYLESLAVQGGPWNTKLDRPAWEMAVLAWGVAYSTLGHFTRLTTKDKTAHTGLVATLPAQANQPELAVLLHRIAPYHGKPTVQVYPAWLCQIAADYFRGREKRSLALAAHQGWIELVMTPTHHLVEVVQGVYTVRLEFLGTWSSQEQ